MATSSSGCKGVSRPWPNWTFIPFTVMIKCSRTRSPSRIFSARSGYSRQRLSTAIRSVPALLAGMSTALVPACRRRLAYKRIVGIGLENALVDLELGADRADFLRGEALARLARHQVHVFV